MIIMGIDPGSQITGYGVICRQGSRLSLIEAGALRLGKQGDMDRRLAFLHTAFQDLLEKHQPQAVAMEKVFHGVNFNSALALGQVRGVILALSALHNVPTAEYASTKVKKSLTGYGRAEKSQIQALVKMMLNLSETPKPHDVADALAIAICHAHHAATFSRVRSQI